MGIFGLEYPEPLRAVVHHAHRFCALLSRLEESHFDPSRWLVGRRDEIVLVVRLRLRDWRARRISHSFAARSIAAYLEDVHAGAVRSLGLPANVALSCCADGHAATVPLAGDLRMAAGEPSPAVAPSAVASKISVDPDALVELKTIQTEIRPLACAGSEAVSLLLVGDPESDERRETTPRPRTR